MFGSSFVVVTVVVMVGTAAPLPNSIGDGNSFVVGATISKSAKGSSLGGACIMFLVDEGESMVIEVVGVYTVY